MELKYWSYLLEKNNLKLLTFESNTDFENLKKGYCELLINGFFDCFSNDYDLVFISEFGPSEKPLEREKKFIIEFDDIFKAKKILDLD